MLASSRQWQDPPHTIELSSKEVHVWCAEISVLSSGSAIFYNILTLDERKRADQFKFEKDRKYFITSRGVLKKILGLYLKTEAKKINLSYNPYGKPYLSAYNTSNPLYFNLSHSGDLALYIFSHSYEVGIDVEKIHHIEDFLDIAQQFFSKQEFYNLSSNPAHKQLECFFKCWTRKEAFIKAVGDGLSYPLDQFEVSLTPDEPAKLLNIQGNTILAKAWSLYSIIPAYNYEASFIFKGKSDNLKFFKFDMTSM